MRGNREFCLGQISAPPLKIKKLAQSWWICGTWDWFVFDRFYETVLRKRIYYLISMYQLSIVMNQSNFNGYIWWQMWNFKNWSRNRHKIISVWVTLYWHVFLGSENKKSYTKKWRNLVVRQRQGAGWCSSVSTRGDLWPAVC